MTQYLLPCVCGQQVRVTTAQAGSRVRCECGRTLQVPTLRGLRRCATVAPGHRERRAKAWGPVRGGLFAAGLVLAAAGLVLAAFYGVRSLQLASLAVDRSGELLRQESAYIDQRSPAELLDLWNAVREEGLADDRVPLWVAAQQRREAFHFWVLVGVGGATLGLAAVLATLIGRR